ncbi:amino acid transporter, putative [Entamoeba histolytica KU27]|uniref:Amino acid transporter, putative n=1 Tax=Entamoeba histolytica KU27 TaxID=885311 RepID=M2S6N0_ENTHI|nr:amino acid transporter, putative [Entamoeba histolytica KU27]
MAQGGAIFINTHVVDDYENIGSDSSEVNQEPSLLDVLPFTHLKGISLLSVFSLTMNIMIGTGVFGMPLAYFEAGLVLSLVLLFIFYLLTSCTALYVLEAISRVGTYIKRNDLLTGYKHSKVDVYEAYGYTSLASHTAGKWFKTVINILMIVNCYGILWSFVGTSVSSIGTIWWSFQNEPEHCPVKGHFSLEWECQATYYRSILFYALLVVPLSFLKLSSQTFVQFLMMLYCVIVFALMLITCFVRLGFDGPISEIKIFDFSGFGTVFSHTAFALVCHISIPDIIAPAEKKNKTHIPIITSLFIASLFYGLIGAVCSVTFGETVQTPVTLNWGSYTGIRSGWTEGKTQWYAYIIRYLIVFFPLVNLTSSFPIVAQTVTGNICSMFSEEVMTGKKKYLIRYSALFISILIPFVLGSISSSLETIFDLTGLISFILVFIAPCVFHLLSIRLFQKCSLFSYHPHTPFSSLFVFYHCKEYILIYH